MRFSHQGALKIKFYKISHFPPLRYILTIVSFHALSLLTVKKRKSGNTILFLRREYTPIFTATGLW
jgi:hypothetical protein